MIINVPIKRWECPNCNKTAATRNPQPHTEYHLCQGMKGLCVPLVEKGTKAKVTANDREDYVGNQTVQTDGDGRPVMSVTVEREDGTDCVVYAPVVNARREG